MSTTVIGLLALADWLKGSKGLPATPLDWIGCQEKWDPDDDALPANPPPAYAIDRQVQRALAELRTDLDAFSDDEAYALTAAGYLMTKHDLAGALPSLARPIRPSNATIGPSPPFSAR